jgi:predicted nucleic acid-binding protein
VGGGAARVRRLSYFNDAYAARRRVEALVDPFRRVGRLVAPTFSDWEAAGDILARLLQERPALRDKLSAPVNDSLVALCALRIGAAVVTANAADFEVLQRYRRFRLSVLV